MSRYHAILMSMWKNRSLVQDKGPGTSKCVVHCEGSWPILSLTTLGCQGTCFVFVQSGMNEIDYY